MQRNKVQAQVRQEINYQGRDERDLFELETEAVLTELTHYSKLSYQDQEGQLVEVKWYPSGSPLANRVDINSGQGLMCFDLSQTFQRDYLKPAGPLPLEFRTQSLAWELDEAHNRLHIQYQILSQEELLGNYDYELIFYS